MDDSVRVHGGFLQIAARAAPLYEIGVRAPPSDRCRHQRFFLGLLGSPICGRSRDDDFGVFERRLIPWIIVGYRIRNRGGIAESFCSGVG